MHSRKAMARARRRDKQTGKSRILDINQIVKTLETEYQPAPYDPVMDLVCRQCGVEYRSVFTPEGAKGFYPAELEKEIAISSGMRENIIETEPERASGKPRFTMLQLQRMRFHDQRFSTAA